MRQLGLTVLAQQRQDRDLDRREARMQPQHGPRVAVEVLLVVGVDEEGQRGAIGAGGGLDHVRHVALAAALIEPLERLA